MSSRETKVVRPPPPPPPLPPETAGEEAVLAESESLAAILGRDGRLSVDRALAVMQDVTSSLADAHAAGRLHGDIQPANVLVAPDGRAELAGFPDASEGAEGAEPPEPRVPLYYPPEAARAKRLDQRSDLFLLGATFYHALAGRPPFDNPNVEDTALLYIRQEAPPLGQVAPGTSVALSCVIHKLIRRKPDERYESALEVIVALDQIQSVIRKTRIVAPRAAAPPARAPAPLPPPPSEPRLAADSRPGWGSSWGSPSSPCSPSPPWS